VEGRSLSAVTHLAKLGVNYAGTGILGLQKIKAARNRCFPVVIQIFCLLFLIWGKCDIV